MKIFIPLFLGLLCCISCDKTPLENEVMCTEEFRTVGLTVVGDSLQDHYTIRISNNDTLRFSAFGFQDNYYTVLDDSYASVLKNKEELFIFHGISDDSLVVTETFVIGADNCHIYKKSGVSQANW